MPATVKIPCLQCKGESSRCPIKALFGMNLMLTLSLEKHLKCGWLMEA